ncbi:hypothetical protein ACO0SA_001375 [Hanseniaspora valbyensis]
MILGNVFSHNNRFYNDSYFKDLKTYYDLNSKIFKWSSFTLFLLLAFVGVFQVENFSSFSYKNINLKNINSELIWMVDVVIVLAFTLFHLIIRAVVINTCLLSGYKFLNKKTNLKLVKFSKLKSLVEQIYYFAYFTAMVFFGYSIFYNTFIQNADECNFKSIWIQLKKIFIPHSVSTSSTASKVFETKEIFPQYHMLTLNVFYLVQISAYLYQLIYILLNLETKRKDYYQMIIHHTVTLVLTIGSYICSFNNIGYLIFGGNSEKDVCMGVENLKYVGHMVMITTDTTDMFLSLSKILNYLTLLPFKKMNYSEKMASIIKSVISNCCDVAFLLGFVISWVLGRHIFYNLIVYNCYFKLISAMTVELEKYGEIVGYTQKHWTLVTSLVSLLLCLQSLQIIWFVMILKLVFRVLNKKIKTIRKQETEKDIVDSRSDDEEEDDDDSDEDDDLDISEKEEDEKEAAKDISNIDAEKIPGDEEFSLVEATKHNRYKKKTNVTIFSDDNASEITLAKDTSITDISGVISEHEKSD